MCDCICLSDRLATPPLPTEKRDNLPNALHRNRQLMLNDLSGQPKHKVPQPPQLCVSTAISRFAAAMGATIHFNHELEFRGDEVADEHPSNGNLTPELHS